MTAKVYVALLVQGLALLIWGATPAWREEGLQSGEAA